MSVKVECIEVRVNMHVQSVYDWFLIKQKTSVDSMLN